ncbi:hypothetical protein TBC1_111143 [Lentimicrobium saccharophilum]|uniref:Uncharacterized protein n=1 Tax=Lentimicrobium saccharophilum TaxID=1678841 RepID=A0A0S7C1J4_9BACT|nr:hypothetical protein TBC1_111143 [Lentimicrobium saccharophilum]
MPEYPVDSTVNLSWIICGVNEEKSLPLAGYIVSIMFISHLLQGRLHYTFRLKLCYCRFSIISF